MAPKKKFKVSDPSNDKENIFLHNVNNFQSKIRRRESIRIKQKKVIVRKTNLFFIQAFTINNLLFFLCTSVLNLTKVFNSEFIIQLENFYQRYTCDVKEKLNLFFKGTDQN